LRRRHPWRRRSRKAEGLNNVKEGSSALNHSPRRQCRVHPQRRRSRRAEGLNSVKEGSSALNHSLRCHHLSWHPLHQHYSPSRLSSAEGPSNVGRVSSNAHRRSHRGSQYRHRPHHRNLPRSRLLCSHRRNAEGSNSEAKASNSVWRRLRRPHQSRYRRHRLHRLQRHVKRMSNGTKTSHAENQW